MLQIRSHSEFTARTKRHFDNFLEKDIELFPKAFKHQRNKVYAMVFRYFCETTNPNKVCRVQETINKISKTICQNTGHFCLHIRKKDIEDMCEAF